MCLWDQNLKFVLSQDILIMMLKIVSTKVSMNLTVNATWYNLCNYKYRFNEKNKYKWETNFLNTIRTIFFFLNNVLSYELSD